LRLDCKRINIFVGEPNTGKSNILEALGLFSYGGYYSYDNSKDFVRFERTSNLFYDENLHEEGEVESDNTVLKLRFRDGSFQGEWEEPGKRAFAHLSGDHNTLGFSSGQPGRAICPASTLVPAIGLAAWL
jgi:recombinational DNA repair ATPase RecF